MLLTVTLIRPAPGPRSRVYAGGCHPPRGAQSSAHGFTASPLQVAALGRLRLLIGEDGAQGRRTGRVSGSALPTRRRHSALQLEDRPGTCETHQMVLHDAPSEVLFVATFDAGRFPYDDAAAASALIERGWSISLNAACCVLNEICRPPLVDHRPTEGRLRELLAEWRAGPSHPLKPALVQCADALIADAPLVWEECLRLMWTISAYEAQRAALLIAYSASDCSDDDTDAALEGARQKIEAAWVHANV